MSVSSATESFTDGAQLFDQEKYQSTVSISIEPDPVQMEKDFQKPLNQRFITLYSDHAHYAKYRLDDVEVRCPSDAFREYQTNQWSIQKTEAANQSWTWAVATLGSGFVALIGGLMLAIPQVKMIPLVGAVVSTPIPAVLLIAGGVAAFVSLFFASNAHTALNQAHDQIQKWGADPLLKIYKERNLAHQEGFPYIYANKLKLDNEPSTTARFHPKQVEHEYKKYFELFCHLLLNEMFHTNKIEWMQAFRAFNPLVSDRMVYGLGAVPDHMKPVIDDYANLESFLNDIENTYDNLKAETINHGQERIDHLNKDLNQKLQLLAKDRDEAIELAHQELQKAHRDPALPTDTRYFAAVNKYNAAKKAAESAYAKNARPINNEFNEKITAAGREQKDRLEKLEDQKKQQFANNCNAARALLTRAKQAWDNEGYQPVNFQQYFPYQQPPMGWHQPAYIPPQPVAQPQPVYAPQEPSAPSMVFDQPIPPAPVYAQP